MDSHRPERGRKHSVRDNNMNILDADNISVGVEIGRQGGARWRINL